MPAAGVCMYEGVCFTEGQLLLLCCPLSGSLDPPWALGLCYAGQCDASIPYDRQHKEGVTPLPFAGA